MTQVVGAHSAYDEDALGNREDLSDMIWDVTPTECPVIQTIGKNRSTAISHEWLTDSLTTGQVNAAIEGDDNVAATDPNARVRLENRNQIFKKHAVVTGTQEEVDKAGMVSEMAYQIERRMEEIKTDVEFAVTGQHNAKVTGSDSVARELGSLSTYIVNGHSGGATSAPPTGNGVDVPTGGTDRTLTEGILDTALQGLYTQSGAGREVMAVVGASHKGVISDFTASSTRYVTTDDKTLVQSIDVLDGDFHTVRVVPSRFIVANGMFVIKPDYLKLSELRSVRTYDLAKTGDSYRKEMVWECTLEVCDPDAHLFIDDLT